VERQAATRRGHPPEAGRDPAEITVKPPGITANQPRITVIPNRIAVIPPHRCGSPGALELMDLFGAMHGWPPPETKPAAETTSSPGAAGSVSAASTSPMAKRPSKKILEAPGGWP
jgi:hypothetical protein